MIKTLRQAPTREDRSAALNPSLRQHVAEFVLGPIDWAAEDQGYCRCPGQHLHTSSHGRKDCAVFLSGAPTIKCLHTSCAAAVENANRQLRSNIGRAERSDGWRPTPQEMRHTKAAIGQRRTAEASKALLAVKANQARTKILERFAWAEVDAWEASPVRLDGRPEDDHRLFLRIFPDDAVIWIGERHQSGKPEHTANFQTARQWSQSPKPAGPLVCPAIFKNGAVSRSADNVITAPFLVVEGDAIDPDLHEKLTKTAALKQDLAAGRMAEAEAQILSQQYEVNDEDRRRNREGCLAIIRWLSEGCGLTLRAVVDAGNKSCHGWFDRPPEAFLSELVTMASGLGLDPATFRPSQPVRLPGWKRETGRHQRLLYLNWGTKQ